MASWPDAVLAVIPALLGGGIVVDFAATQYSSVPLNGFLEQLPLVAISTIVALAVIGRAIVRTPRQ